MQNTTSFAAPKPSLSAVNCADCLIISDIFKTASILIPAFEVATFTDEQSLFVEAKASGIDSISAKSPFVKPFSTRAEYPPIKSMPRFVAHSSSVFAIFT